MYGDICVEKDGHQNTTTKGVRKISIKQRNTLNEGA